MVMLKKRIISPILVIALVITLAANALPVSAADNSTFSFTNYPNENITFSLGNGMLTISNLPEHASFSSAWVRILDEKQTAKTEDLVYRKTDRSMSISLRGLKDGSYYIELYFPIGGDDYVSYIYGYDLKFLWENGSGKFAEAQTLGHNRRAYESARTDNAAQVYYLAPSYAIQSDAKAITALAKDITQGIGDDYAKALAIHDWVCANLWYDWDSIGSGRLPPGDAVSTLSTRLAVCSGFATLTTALLRAAGIPAKLVSGYSLDITTLAGWTGLIGAGVTDNHAWTEAYVNGRWIIIDTTYDSGNNWSGGRKSSSGGVLNYRYFDATLEGFSIDHLISEYNYIDGMIPPQDEPSDWAVGQINAAAAAGLVPRSLGMKFSQAITRAEFCLLAVTLYEKVTGKEITERAGFSDTTDINVEKIAGLGIVTGVGGGKFAPGDRLTREQAAVMLFRLLKALGKQMPEQAPAFTDSSLISDWAVSQVGSIQGAGIMGGVGNDLFAPKQPYTREQSIITILRVYNYILA